MTAEQAIRACWWTTNVTETIAWGSTSDPEAAEFFGALNDRDEFKLEAWTNPNRRGWAVKVPRWLQSQTIPEAKIENVRYQQIVAEIERRKHESDDPARRR